MWGWIDLRTSAYVRCAVPAAVCRGVMGTFPGNTMHSDLIRERLQQRRQELESRAERIGSDLRREAMPVEGGFADQAADRANDTVLDAIRDSAELELQQINNALRRLAEGRYQSCEICDGPIAQERLEAVPYATTCTVCAAGGAPSSRVR